MPGVGSRPSFEGETPVSVPERIRPRPGGSRGRVGGRDGTPTRSRVSLSGPGGDEWTPASRLEIPLVVLAQGSATSVDPE